MMGLPVIHAGYIYLSWVIILHGFHYISGRLKILSSQFPQAVTWVCLLCQSQNMAAFLRHIGRVNVPKNLRSYQLVRNKSSSFIQQGNNATNLLYVAGGAVGLFVGATVS